MSNEKTEKKPTILAEATDLTTENLKIITTDILNKVKVLRETLKIFYQEREMDQRELMDLPISELVKLSINIQRIRK